MIEGLPILKEAAQVPGLLKEIYGDLAKPGIAQVGKALSTILGLGNTILWPITILNEKAKIALENNLEKYRAQLENIPEEKIVTVSPEIGVPLSEKLSYVTNEELSNLYINLLAKASTVDTANLAHPSFVNIINNLCPDEALLLEEMKHEDVYPFLAARLAIKGTGNWFPVDNLLTGFEKKVELAFPHNIVAYFSNFEGLGIIQIRDDLHIAVPPFYEKLEELYRPSYASLEFDPKTQELQFKQGKIEVTPFGRLFIGACLTKLK